MTERERYLVEASYSQDVLDDRTRTIQVYEAMLRLDPGDAQALNNIGFNYWMQGDFERAGEYYRRAREADPSQDIYAANVAAAWANTGEMQRADSAYAVLDETSDSPQFKPWRALFEYQRGNEEAARSQFIALAERYATQPGTVAFARRTLGTFELVHGRMRAADALLSEGIDLDRGRGDEGAALRHGLGKAAFLLITVKDTAAALRELDRALLETPLDRLPVLDRPWVWAASIAARAGDAALARELIGLRDAEVSPRFLEIERRYEHDFQAWLALAEGDAGRALAELRQQPADGCPRCLPADFAHLFDAMGQADSAIARYEQYLETPSNFQLWLDAMFRAPAHERLGQLYDERGDLENAALHYAQFVELWEDADPVLQPRVEAARARLQAIVRERG